jgi:hypothetical protein
MEQRIKTKNIMGMVAGPASETSDGDRKEVSDACIRILGSF